MKVKLCMGSNCVMMGSMSIQTQLEELKSSLEWDELEIEFDKCMDYCKGSAGSSPVVIINDEVIRGATSEVVMEKVMAVYHLEHSSEMI